MRETIGVIASHISAICLIVMLVAVTVESAAKGHAITAAIFSPMAVLALVFAGIWVADLVGWIEL